MKNGQKCYLVRKTKLNYIQENISEDPVGTRNNLRYTIKNVVCLKFIRSRMSHKELVNMKLPWSLEY